MPLGKTNKNVSNELRVPSKGVVGWRRLAPMMKLIGTRLGINISVEGMDIQEIDGGVHMKGKPGTAVSGHPFKLVTEIVSGVSYVRFVPGEVVDELGLAGPPVEVNGVAMDDPSGRYAVGGDGSYLAYMRVEAVGESSNLGSSTPVYVTDSMGVAVLKILVIAGDLTDLPTAVALEIDRDTGIYEEREVDGEETENGVWFFPVATFIVASGAVTVTAQHMRSHQVAFYRLFSNLNLVPTG